MKTLNFSKRVAKEILRDPLTLFFGVGFPTVLIILLSVIQKNIPVSLFEIETLVPGVSIFGLSFITLFPSMLVSGDRESAFLVRLYSMPMRPLDFILGYTLPFLPISIVQTLVSYGVGMCFGLKPGINMLYALITLIPASVLFIGLGLAFGSVLNQKQAGGICGTLLTNLSAWLSGIWFDLELVGGVFKTIATLLPFYHAVELERAVFRGASFSSFFENLLVVSVYALISMLVAVILFLKQMRK
jgi:ABC-2 type transport system permease protein